MRFDKSTELLARARRVTPNGSQTLSRAANMWPEGAAPTHIAHAQGCQFKDVDGNTFIDYVMGLASVGLGYCHPSVNVAVEKQLWLGSIFSLASALEAEVAERLIYWVPCAQQVRFVKTGSEANEAAIRIARAATGRDVILTCGYHSWHSWYAASKPSHPGVPKAMESLVYAFNYNDLDSLRSGFALNGENVAAVIMEPTLMEEPAPDFLRGVRAMCEEYGALLIFDEVVTGWRWHEGGYQALCGVTPDLATFGKAMANGFPLAAVVGQERYMAHAGFVSSTFGPDCIALAAAKATIDAYKDENGITKMYRAGALFRDGFNALCTKLDVPYKCIGAAVKPKIVATTADESTNRLLMSVFLQETIRRGVLFHVAGFNVSAAHTPVLVSKTLDACQGAFISILQHEPGELLEGKLYHEVFRRSG